MSNTANWSYTNVAAVRPYLGMDEWGTATYGAEYEIACTWTAEATQQRANNGAEFVARHIVFTEDARPAYLDLIRLGTLAEWEEIRSRTYWDMSFFNETPDYKLVT